MMALIYLCAIAILAGGVSVHAWMDESQWMVPCPQHLKIGGIYYDRAPDTCYNCPPMPSYCFWYDNPVGCIYQMRGLLGSRYCLKQGDLETVKENDTRPFCTYDNSQYVFRPLLEDITAVDATACSIKCTDIDGLMPTNDPAPPVCRGWSYSMDTQECYLYNWYTGPPFPNSLAAGLIQPKDGCISGPRGCIIGGPNVA